MAWSDAARAAAQRARELKRLERSIRGTTLKKGGVTLSYRGETFNVARSRYLKQLMLHRYGAKKLGIYHPKIAREAAIRSLHLARLIQNAGEK